MSILSLRIFVYHVSFCFCCWNPKLVSEHKFWSQYEDSHLVMLFLKKLWSRTSLSRKVLWIWIFLHKSSTDNSHMQSVHLFNQKCITVALWIISLINEVGCVNSCLIHKIQTDIFWLDAVTEHTEVDTFSRYTLYWGTVVMRGQLFLNCYL